MTADAHFSGWVTKNNMRCADGRTILENAFAGDDGVSVPLVWEHGRDNVENILGHVILENRPEGVFGHGYFNDSAKAAHARSVLKNKDIRYMSIFAGGLKERVTSLAHKLRDVMEGSIIEVSLVTKGANPGATIESVNLAHSYDGEDFIEEGIITTGDPIVLGDDLEGTDLEHAASSKTDPPVKSGEQIVESMTEEQRDFFYYMLSQSLTHSALQHSTEVDDETDSDKDDETDSDKADEPNKDDETDSDKDDTDAEANKDTESDDADADKDAEDKTSEDDSDKDSDATDEDAADKGDDSKADDTVEHSNTNTQEGDSMTFNVFDQTDSAKGGSMTGSMTLAHGAVSKEDATRSIIADLERTGSLARSIKDYVLEHGYTGEDGTLQHGIENISYLFPDPKKLENSPNFLARRMEWVTKVLDGVRKTPFARIRTIHADITMDEARARGYITGNYKEEEFFELIRRDTVPQTVYKRQSLHRDDVLDITDLDVIAWVKAEMKLMLDEEIAGAILIGDARSNGDADKIKTANVRPIASDSELYVTNVRVNLDDSNSSMEELVDEVINNRWNWKGTGMPTFYTSASVISRFLNTKDGFGRRIYSSLSQIAEMLRVADIVEVEVFNRTPDILGIMVNLADYSIGTDRGGQATMFDDFNLQYNKLEYLLETRLSGALTIPKAAIVFRKTLSTDTVVTPTAPARSGNTITVPTVTGVTYKDAAGNTLVNGTPTTLTAGQKLVVTATANSGRYFSTDAETKWTYRYDATPS